MIPLQSVKIHSSFIKDHQSKGTHLTSTYPVHIQTLLPAKSPITKKKYYSGGFNPTEKYARQIGSFPQVDGKAKNI